MSVEYPSTVIHCIGCDTRVQLFSDGHYVSIMPLEGWVADELGQWLCPNHRETPDA